MLAVEGKVAGEAAGQAETVLLQIAPDGDGAQERAIFGVPEFALALGDIDAERARIAVAHGFDRDVLLADEIDQRDVVHDGGAVNEAAMREVGAVHRGGVAPNHGELAAVIFAHLEAAGHLEARGGFHLHVIVITALQPTAVGIVAEPAEVGPLVFPLQPGRVPLLAPRTFPLEALGGAGGEFKVELVALVAGVGDVDDQGIPIGGAAVVRLHESTRFPEVDLVVELETDRGRRDVLPGEDALDGEGAMREDGDAFAVLSTVGRPAAADGFALGQDAAKAGVPSVIRELVVLEVPLHIAAGFGGEHVAHADLGDHALGGLHRAYHGDLARHAVAHAVHRLDDPRGLR